MDPSEQIAQSFELMQRIIEYRYDKPLHHQLMKTAEYSMLGVDVLILIHHMAKNSSGGIFEIGSFLGASTIAAGLGMRAAGQERKIVSIELGGRLDNHRLATRDIVKQLKKNLAKAHLLDRVVVLTGWSFDEQIVSAVKQIFRPGEVGLFVFDADAEVQRDLNIYGDLLADDCWVVIDDYIGGTNKTGPINHQVEELTAEGKLVPLGCYGWGTWIGRWKR